MVLEEAAAKVNLFLHVLGRDGRGYHRLDSLAVFAGAADLLQAEPASDLRLTVEGPFAPGLVEEGDNLVLRAARLLAAHVGVRPAAHLRLEKHLPVASGIGGGSADAAAALRVLCRLWQVDPGAGTLLGLAERLGADVPVCVASRPVRMQGVGEVLLPAPVLPPCGLLLVNPGVALSTAAVFRYRREMPGETFTDAACLPDAWSDAAAMARDLSACGNDLQAAALELCPPIGDVLAAIAALPGCLLARMSGSGATCFGLFGTVGMAEQAVSSLPTAWWRWGGGLRSAGPPVY